MSVQTSISCALFVYLFAAIIGMLVSVLIKITYSVVHWLQGKTNVS